MKFEYTGDGCDVFTNPQGGSAFCRGGADGAEPVGVRITDRRGLEVYADDATVIVGDVIEAMWVDKGRIGPQINIEIDGDLEFSTIHNSCSQPIRVGDQFGSMRLIEKTLPKATAKMNALRAIRGLRSRRAKNQANKANPVAACPPGQQRPGLSVDGRGLSSSL